jgi:hypothetical protein
MADTPEDSIKKSQEEANVLAGIFGNMKKEMKDLSKSFEDSLNPLAGINQSMAAQINAAKTLNKLTKSDLLDKNLQKNLESQMLKLKKEITGSENIQKDLRKAVVDKAKEVVKLNKKGLSLKQLEHGFGGKFLKNKAKELSDLKKAENLNKQNIDHTKTLGDKMGAVHKEAEKVNAAGAGFQKMADGLKKVPIIGGTLSKSFTAAAEKAREVASEGGKFPKVQGAAAGVKEMVAQFTSLPGILTFIISTFTEIDKNATQLSKSMNMSYEAGLKMDSSLRSASLSNEDNVAYTENLVKAQMSLAEESGIYHMRSKETLETNVMLTERLGLNNKEAAKLEKFALASGKNYKKLAKETMALGVNIGKANKLNFSGKKLMQEVANVSAEISTNLGNDPKKIMEAVVASKLLGTSLQVVAQTVKSLTDFEGSIAKEMEAELLMGRDLNLERARSLALAGDLTGLAQELQQEVGTEAEYLEMNVIQRQALADSLGMNVEQLGEMFLTQEQQKALQEEQAELKEEELLRNATQLELMQELQGIAKKFGDLFKKLWEGPIGNIGKAFKDWIKDGNNIKKLFDKIKGIMGIIQKIFKFIVFRAMVKWATGIVQQISLTGALGTRMRVNALTSGTKAAADSASSAARNPIPIVGVAAGIAAFIAMQAYVNSMLPSFDTGGQVAKTGFAKVHAGEMVTPAEKVEGTEGGFSGLSKSDVEDAMTNAVEKTKIIFTIGAQQFAEAAADLAANQGEYGESLA